MPKVVITIEETALHGASISVSPDLDVLGKAAGFGKLTAAETYALGALNAMRVVSEATGGDFTVARPKNVKRVYLRNSPVKKVTLTIEDKPNGGVACVSAPRFQDMAAMVAGGTEVTLSHKYALVGLSKIIDMNSKKPLILEK